MDDRAKSTASGVFWGLFLFFIVLPLGTCAACAFIGGLAAVAAP